MEEINNNELNAARKAYFDEIAEKNIIDHTRLDKLDVEHIGITLNYQQIKLMQLALKGNETLYRLYQDSLIDFYDVFTETGKKKRLLLVLEKLLADEDIPTNTFNILKDIYDQSKNNPKIDSKMIEKIMITFLFKLSTSVQDLIYKKVKEYGTVEKEGIKKMTSEEAIKLFNYVDKDYTSITIDSTAKYENYVLPNGSFYRDELKNILEFAYENDKQVRINALISKIQLPNYIKKLPKEVIKQKLISYVDDITKYISMYNSRYTRTDRQLFIRSIDCFNELLDFEYPYNERTSGWQEFLSLDDLCDAIKVARQNLPEVDFVYNEPFLEDKVKRKQMHIMLNKIKKYEIRENVKLIDTIGTQMHVNLDVQKDDIEDMLEFLSKLDLKVAITEFDVCPSEDMLENNTKEEIEILRERFISDLCNVITSFQLSKKIDFDSVSIWTVSDSQSFMTSLINEKRLQEKKPLLVNVYGGMYDVNMNRKYKEPNKRGRKKSKKSDEKGAAEGVYVSAIVGILVIIIIVVIYLFTKFI